MSEPQAQKPLCGLTTDSSGGFDVLLFILLKVI